MKSYHFILLLCIFNNFHNAQFTKFGSRIVGGANANAGQFPFSAAIIVQMREGQFFCGGALITSSWILTAAICADGAVQFTIRLGSNILAGNDPNRVIAASTHYVLYPGYTSSSLEHNIALIQLRLPVQFTEYIQPIQLTSREVPVYSHLTAIGWGQTSDSDPSFADHLQYVSLITVTNAECQSVYGLQISSDMVCATGNYLEGTCIGDIGSPLIEHIYNPQGVRHAGIASFISGDGCEQPHPSGYTRTFLYLDWIANVTNGVQ